MLPVLKRVTAAVKPGGYMVLNMQDPLLKRKRFPFMDDALDTLVNETPMQYVGEIGMRLTQRCRNLPKEQLKNYLSKCYVEPMWVLQKVVKKSDIVIPKRLLVDSSLESK